MGEHQVDISYAAHTERGARPHRDDSNLNSTLFFEGW
jgi:hypothetical protein